MPDRRKGSSSRGRRLRRVPRLLLASEEESHVQSYSNRERIVWLIRSMIDTETTMMITMVAVRL